jgi:hypothetical protein
VPIHPEQCQFHGALPDELPGREGAPWASEYAITVVDVHRGQRGRHRISYRGDVAERAQPQVSAASKAAWIFSRTTRELSLAAHQIRHCSTSYNLVILTQAAGAGETVSTSISAPSGSVTSRVDQRLPTTRGAERGHGIAMLGSAEQKGHGLHRFVEPTDRVAVDERLADLHR